MDINEYIEKVYNNSTEWFADEVKKATHLNRIADVLENKDYLAGRHKVLKREDIKYKEQEYITRKIVIQEAKTILNFHSTYLLGKPISLVGTENMVKECEKIYRRGEYNDIDYRILDKMSKYGDAYEYVYIDNGTIKSKIIDSADGYPVYSEDGQYVAFVEYWIINAISYYNVYYMDHVEEWNNEGGELNLVNEYKNITGLPIHYHSLSDEDDNFGISVLKDIRPLLDEIEDLLSKMGDGIYTLSLNPILTTIGQQLEGTISADAVGYSVALEAGSDMKYVTATMDYSTIKLYLDTLAQKLNLVAHMPSIVGGNTNVANVSEVSLKLLYQLADVMAMLNEKCIRKGIRKRFEIFKKILELKGIKFAEDDYIDVEFNYSRPVNAAELLDNISKQFAMGAISKRSIIEKSPLTSNVDMEMNRLKKEDSSNNSTNEIITNDKKQVTESDLNQDNHK
ncbi:phage portal protein [Clostridium sp. P21]|uniref:Phage portal protein n=1 Tax=Clostridium muellerianum TaxID=2716538 RepID=A0A7Y0EL78_9CLOT|nr:phage portal protein [Clostridium muellerianum]NMM65543.1 phage portal protein [Clostridium muellerianum]